MKSREVTQGMVSQGVDEAIGYDLTVTAWGSNPTDVSFKVLESTGVDWIDWTATVAPVGTISVAGDVITLPAIKNLSEGHTYRCFVTFSLNGNVLSAFFDIKAER